MGREAAEAERSGARSENESDGAGEGPLENTIPLCLPLFSPSSDRRAIPPALFICLSERVRRFHVILRLSAKRDTEESRSSKRHCRHTKNHLASLTRSVMPASTASVHRIAR